MAVFAPTTATAVTGRTLSVTGTEAEMYPTFDPAITRYAVTTTANTGGSLTIDPTPAPGETVTVNGQAASGATVVDNLDPGDEVSVVFRSSAGRTGYSVVYLPAGFPKLTVTTGAHQDDPDLEPGLIGMVVGLASPSPSFDTIVDRNGVPIYAEAGAQGDLDLKQQPNGEITVSRPTTTVDRTGAALVTLDDSFQEAARRETVGLTNTDNHDSIRLPNGNTVLVAYELDPDASVTDAVIQEIDTNGGVVFEWNSRDYEAETVNQNGGDYAHINSVQVAPDGSGDIVASFRHFSSVYRIATTAHDGHAPGDVIWKFGGRDSAFAMVDDPYSGGPCAQHAVTLMTGSGYGPDGHLLVFDNGSGSIFGNMCLDGTDLLGTTIARPQTRVTEYALDVTHGEATLVSSYEPTGKFVGFAGGATRTSNGDTLIGWAADRTDLATEINASQVVVWNLRTPVPDTGTRYATYRAALITALAPGITFSGAGEGATVVVGDQVAADATCRDFAGRAIATCAVSGLLDGKLDTRTPGTRTWQATASYGAGNTTTVTRHYTVRTAVRQPDGLIRKAGSSTWKGGNLYGATGQSVHQRAHRRHTATSFWKVQNDGERSDGFVLKGTGSSKRFKVHYFVGSTDVTSAVLAGTYRTATLGTGSSTVLRVEVTPTRRAHVGDARAFRLRSASASSSAVVDTVSALVTARS